MLWRHDRQSELTIALCASPSAGGTVSGGGTFASGSSRTVAVDRQQRLHVCHLDRERHCGQLIGNLHAHPQRQSRPGGQFRRQSTAPTVKANARSQQAYQLDRAGAGLVGDSPCPGPRSEMAARSLGEFYFGTSRTRIIVTPAPTVSVFAIMAESLPGSAFRCFDGGLRACLT
jgi:hypothetical protein